MGDRAHLPARQHDSAERALLAVSGVLIQLLGGVLVVSVFMLADRASFAALAGVGLMLAGNLIARRKRAGAWIFMAVIAVTLGWSLQNLQSGGTSLAMRLIGPTVLLCMIALLMPALRGWRARRTLAAFTTMLAGMIGLGISTVSYAPVPATALVQLLAE